MYIYIYVCVWNYLQHVGFTWAIDQRLTTKWDTPPKIPQVFTSKVQSIPSLIAGSQEQRRGTPARSGGYMWDCRTHSLGQVDQSSGIQ